jgi:serine/threonine protein kinase
MNEITITGTSSGNLLLGNSIQLIPNGDITLDRRIGEGNFGQVYSGNALCKLLVTLKGTWNSTHVALKKFKDSESQSEFAAEITVLAQLSHPNIGNYW